MELGRIAPGLGADSMFAGKLRLLEVTDSTNTRLAAMAAAGAPEGTVLLAQRQTCGRGTGGRAFFSRAGGLYFSVLLRPRCPAEELFTLAGRTAAAVCRAIETVCHAPVEIKWLNDILLHGKKLCGILTELAPLKGGTAGWVVIGIGINVEQSGDDLAADGLGEMAVSLAQAGYAVSREALCLAILRELEGLYRAFPGDGAYWLAEYRARCATLGRQVLAENGSLRGLALSVAEDFSLTIRGEDGVVRRVFSGGVTLL